MEYTTVFRRKAERILNTASTMRLIAVAWAAVSVGIYNSTDGHYILLPGPLIFIVILFYCRTRKSDINFFVRKNAANDYLFTYVEDRKKNDDFWIKEYSSWYVETNSRSKGKGYTLVIMISTGPKTFYLKEDIFQVNPPPDWTASKVKVENEKDVFLVPDLQLLITAIDSGAVIEEEAELLK